MAQQENKSFKHFNSSSNVLKVHLSMKMLQIKKEEIFPEYIINLKY